MASKAAGSAALPPWLACPCSMHHAPAPCTTLHAPPPGHLASQVGIQRGQAAGSIGPRLVQLCRLAAGCLRHRAAAAAGLPLGKCAMQVLIKGAGQQPDLQQEARWEGRATEGQPTSSMSCRAASRKDLRLRSAHAPGRQAGSSSHAPATRPMHRRSMRGLSQVASAHLRAAARLAYHRQLHALVALRPAQQAGQLRAAAAAALAALLLRQRDE